MVFCIMIGKGVGMAVNSTASGIYGVTLSMSTLESVLKSLIKPQRQIRRQLYYHMSKVAPDACALWL